MTPKGAVRQYGRLF